MVQQVHGILASPWYAPGNMVETVNGESRVKYDMYDDYAAHLDSFASYMANNGAPIYGLSVQNEPEYGENWTGWTINEIFTFMKENAYAINGTKVMAPESFHFDRAYSDPILNDSIACANTDIICGHRYYGPIGDGTSASNPDDPDETYPAKGEVTKKGYVMSQYSKFIRPGNHRIESSVYPFTTNISVSAYKDSASSKEVIIAINKNTSDQDIAFKILNLTNSTFTPYTTSETKNVEQGEDINIDNNIIILNIDASSITTFVSNE
ncbi:MAG: hypothetical protein P8Y99_07785 [Calditrichaceae bacterium]